MVGVTTMMLMAPQKISDALLTHSHMMVPSAWSPSRPHPPIRSPPPGILAAMPAKGTAFAIGRLARRTTISLKEGRTMPELQDIEQEILATGRIDTEHLEAL